VDLTVGVAEVLGDGDAALAEFIGDRHRWVFGAVAIDERPEEVERDCHWAVLSWEMTSSVGSSGAGFFENVAEFRPEGFGSGREEPLLTGRRLQAGLTDEQLAETLFFGVGPVSDRAVDAAAGEESPVEGGAPTLEFDGGVVVTG
jgi:hypothetical protein